MNFDEKCQIVLVGDSTVGKTSLLLKYTNGSYSEDNLATVGLDFITKDEIINEKTIRVKIWDTAGQERYKSLTQGFFRLANGAIIVFDVSNNDSFVNLKYWVSALRNFFNLNQTVFNVIIVGNKIDKEREVSQEDANNFAKENGITYFEVSAKTGEGVKESFIYIVNKCVQSKEEKGEEMYYRKIDNKEEKEKKKCIC